MWALLRAERGWPLSPLCESGAYAVPAQHLHCHAAGRTSTHAAWRPRSPPRLSCRRRGGAPRARCHVLP
eukprot:9486900-Pyramimonas_sp.AAC.1